MTRAMGTALPRRNASHTFLAIFLATFLLSTAWMLVIGPFRAMDEYDHAFRANSVAQGNWGSPEGGRLVVDRSLDEAIRPVCVSRREPDSNCDPIEYLAGDKVLVTSTAAAYNPVFYWIVGTTSKPFDGYAQLYAMRLLLTALNALIVAGALMIALRFFQTSWPAWAVVLTMTPQAASAGMVVAPNGLESSCALLIWMCLLATACGSARPGLSRWLPYLAMVAGAFMGVLRSLGPVWLICIVLMVALATGALSRGDEVRRQLVRSRFATKSWLACAAVWTASSCAGLAWALGAGANRLPDAGTTRSSVGATVDSISASVTADGGGASFLRPLVWLFQTIGALPYRDQPLPLGAYAVALALWGAFVVVATRVSARSFRRSAGAIALVSFGIPIAFSVVTGLGGLWQGRYCWPLAMGVFLVLGVGLDRRDPPASSRVHHLVAWTTCGSLAVVMVWSLVHVAQDEREKNPLAGDSAWWTAPDSVVAAMAVVAFALFAWALLGPRLPEQLNREAGQSPPPARSTNSV